MADLPICTSLPSSFLANVLVLENGCWQWMGTITEDGYGRWGRFPRPDGLSAMAHRFVHQRCIGWIPDGHQVDHTCHDPKVCNLTDDCPHRRCVNPLHLKAVTARENVRRSNGPAAANLTKTHCPEGHSFAEHAIWEGNKRRCGICRPIQRRADRRLAREARARIAA